MVSQLRSVKTSADWPYFVVADDKDPTVVVPADFMVTSKRIESAAACASARAKFAPVLIDSYPAITVIAVETYFRSGRVFIPALLVLRLFGKGRRRAVIPPMKRTFR